MKNNSKYGNQWKALRERRGLTQTDVARTLGYSTPQFISNVERGRCRFPIQKLSKLRKLYRMSVDQMVDLVAGEERENVLKAFKRS